MSALESLIETLSLVSFGFAVGVNIRQYTEAKKWLISHRVDCSFYEDKIKGLKKSSALNSMRYYLGYPGRVIAYKKHSKVDNSL